MQPNRIASLRYDKYANENMIIQDALQDALSQNLIVKFRIINY